MKKKILCLTILLSIILCGCTNTLEKAEKKTSSEYDDISENLTESKEEYDNSVKMFSEPENQLFTDNEKENIENKAVEAAKSVWSCYGEIETDKDSLLGSNIGNFTDEKRIAVVDALGNLGLVVRSADINTTNPALVDEFFMNYRNGKPAMITVFEVCRDGLISTLTFLYRNDEIQSYYVGIAADENKKPVISGKLIQGIDYINLTEKGYFFYAYEDILDHQSLCQYFRVKPLSEKCRKLTEKYISELNFQKYNLMITDWDEDSVSKILMPGLFDDFYFIKYGTYYQEAVDFIPAKLFEEIMTTYLPVTVEQLRKAYEYNEETNEYRQGLTFNRPYPPFGEVVDFTRNSDGTITLFVDGVWPDYRSDYAFTDTVIIRPITGNEFRILSNKVEKKELELPSVPESIK